MAAKEWVLTTRFYSTALSDGDEWWQVPEKVISV